LNDLQVTLGGSHLILVTPSVALIYLLGVKNRWALVLPKYDCFVPDPLAYFVEGKAATADLVEPFLWNADVGADAYGGDTDKYRGAVLEQYRLYVEMADRVSARRGLANTFFLTLNTAVFTTLGLFATHSRLTTRWLLVFPLIVLLAECLTWFWIVRSYRQLNSGKWAVVGALEKRLPASPWWNAEWEALGRGEKPELYWPLTHIEQIVPLLFALTYLGAFIAVMVS
jgi:hypothetical protein